jgi:pantothenate kinase
MTRHRPVPICHPGERSPLTPGRLPQTSGAGQGLRYISGLDALTAELDGGPDGRRLVGITGPPGAGKSFTAAALAARLTRPTAVVAMDGFHLANEVLDGLGRREYKGRPDTFDADGFAALLERLRRHDPAIVYAPRFDRDRQETVGSAIAVGPDVEIVLVEGNYLLVDDVRWRPVTAALDATYYLEVPAPVRAARLLTRHRVGHGTGAEAWIERVDAPNAAIVEATRGRATAVVIDLG